MSVNISPLSEFMSLLPELAELHQCEWGHLDASVTLESRSRALKGAAQSDGIPAVYIAHEEGRLLGSAALVEHDMKGHYEGCTPWLAAVYVKAEFRSQGLASRLVRYCENQAKNHGARQLYLYTQFAEPLYAKLAWNVLDRIQYHGVSVTVMERKLS